jgi:ribonuclease HII
LADLIWATESFVVGVDEAGRGPLAGPVVAAAVILPPNVTIAGLQDSKKLSETQRARLEPIIKATACGFGVGMADANEIDALNILEATYLAMRRALLALPLAPRQVFIDGNRLPQLHDLLAPTVPVSAIIQGDGKIGSIAAASVLAKTWRDRYMCTLAERCPGYGFEAHKGYGAPSHLAALARLGPTAFHRLSFKPLNQGVRPA